jgi:hypothetical protein
MHYLPLSWDFCPLQAPRHDTAKVLGLEKVLKELDTNFHLARRPLNYISENYLQFRKHKLWRIPAQN